MTRRQLQMVIAALVLATFPALASDEALRCATLTPESFTVEQFAVLERHAPVLHGYLANGLFQGLDARQRFRLVSQATTGTTDWNDVSLPGPFYPVTGTEAERVAMMSGYETACDTTLGAYVSLSIVVAEADAVAAFGDAVLAQFEAQDDILNCTEIEKCQRERRECMERARDTRDTCIADADLEEEEDLEDCREEYDNNIQEGMNATLAALLLSACNAGANTKHVAAVAECAAEYVTDVAKCTGEYVECMTRAINPL